MVDNGIKPVYVFDGKPPDMKSGEVSGGVDTAETPFVLISREFLIFTNLNCHRRTYNFNKKLERLSKLLLFQ